MCYQRTRQFFGLFVCLLETFLLTGCIHGFVSIIGLFQQDGVYYDICRNLTGDVDNTDVDNPDVSLSVLYHYDCTSLWVRNREVYRWFRCEEEETTFTQIFTVSLFLPMALMPLVGWVYDRYGSWITRIIAIILLIVGNVMAAFVDRATSDVLWPAMIFTSQGGLILFVTNLQLTNIVYTKRSIWLALYVTLHFASSGVYTLMKVFSDYLEISRRYIFFIMLGFTALPILTTFFFHPITHVRECDFDVSLFTSSSHIKMNSRKIHRETMAKSTSSADKASVDHFWMKDRRFDGVACSLSFMLHAFWFGSLQGQCWLITSLRYTMIPMDQTDTIYLGRRDEVFCYLQIGLSLLALVIGLLTDTQRWRIVKDYIDSETIHVKAILFAVIVTTLPAGVLAGVVFIPSARILYLVDALIVIVRVTSLTTCCLFVLQIFPQKYFGRLLGTSLCIGAIFGVCYLPVQVLHGQIEDGEHNQHAYIKLGVATAIFLALSHPIHLIIRIRRLERASIKTQSAGCANSPSADDIIFLPVEELRRISSQQFVKELPPKNDQAKGQGSTRF